jgi:ankyrin repeat protein
VKVKDNDGRNALHLLCEHNSSEKLIDVIKLLIDNKIDLNEKNNHEWNALHLLCQHNSSEKLMDAIKLLIEHGIEVISNGLNAQSLLLGNSQYRWKNNNIEEIIQFLEKI